MTELDIIMNLSMLIGLPIFFVTMGVIALIGNQPDTKISRRRRER